VMPKFPVDAPKRRVVKTLEILGFVIVREKEHISLQRTNPDGSRTALTMPNHPTLRPSTLRAIWFDPTVSVALLRPGF
jgi:predicted RNA binding protein YcfA (HicA-like mRNA interferase family)